MNERLYTIPTDAGKMDKVRKNTEGKTAANMESTARTIVAVTIKHEKRG